MTSQRDLDTAAEVSLTICAKCGWYDSFTHASRCDPPAGKAAARLIAAVPEVRAGQLGYGDGHVVFDIAKDFTVLFEFLLRQGPRTFALRDVHLLGNLDVDEAAALVRALKSWFEETLAKRTK